MEKSFTASSYHLRVLEYYKYFNKILSYEKPNFNEAFLREFIDDYIASVANFDVWGTEPEQSKEILSQLKKLTELNITGDRLPILKTEIERIEKQERRLTSIIEGKDNDKDYDRNEDYCKEHKAFFPLVAEESPKDFYGILESVTIHVRKAEDADKFIIVPSEKEIEKKILEQCKRSWFAALDLSREYIKKPYKHHEVIISFDKKEGFYEGSSLGIALTISLLEQLLKFYNPTYIIKIKEQTAFTGGITEEGKVLPCGEEIIKQKVKAVFFSPINSFILTKADEIPAHRQLLELQKEYPQRNLKLIPVEDINDVLNRRDVVDIRKQKFVIRTGKFVKKNWVSAVATVLLAILFGYLFVVDWDDNPASIETEGLLLLVKNKNEKILWTKKLDEYLSKQFGIRLLDNYGKIIDVNGDKTNEVLICKQILISKEFGDEGGSILCLNKRGEFLWKYNFIDSVSSKREDLAPPYYIELIDTLSENGRKQLTLFANNGASYASAIFKLDLLTGKRIKGTHWCSGFTYESTVKDVNKDGILDLILVGKDNGYDESVLWILPSNKIFGFRPSTDEYNIKNQPESDLIGYVRFQKTDFDIVNYPKTLIVNQGSIDGLQEKDNFFVSFFIYDTLGVPDYNTAINYKFSYDLRTVDAYIGDRFAQQRDSLVLSGKISPPFTDTKEYRKILRDRLLYYNNDNWVKREELN
jgi:hypothetical protein